MADQATTTAQVTTEAVQTTSTETPPANAAAAAGGAPVEGSAKSETTTSTQQEAVTSVPEKYDLKLPDGSPLDAKAIEEVAAYAKEKGLSQEQAQAVLERESNAVSAFHSKQLEDYKAKVGQWETEVQNDKELGGSSMKENMEVARRALDLVASPSLKEMLDSSGLGSHPEVIRAFYKFGKMMSEDKLVVPGPQSGGKRSLAEIMYPNSNT